MINTIKVLIAFHVSTLYFMQVVRRGERSGQMMSSSIQFSQVNTLEIYYGQISDNTFDLRDK